MSQTTPLHSYLDPELIHVQADISSSKKLLQEMAHLLALPLESSDPDENCEKTVYHLLLEREKLGNTGIGNGVALPHSRYRDTERAVIAIITLKDAVNYDSADRQPVDLAFGLIVPEQATSEHLTLLADIARMLSQEDNKQRLSSAQSADEAIELIRSWAQA